MKHATRIAFYDFDGTLASGNVVQRYAFFAKRQPSKARAILKCSKLLASVPVLIGLDFYSRRLFNRIFFREYAGMRENWLRGLEQTLFEEAIRPTLYPGAKALVDSDRAQGFSPVLVTGELDFAIAPVVRYFAFDAAITNAMVFKNGAATGEVAPPLIAEEEKVAAMRRLCRERGVDLADCKAYSDSFSDKPMLECVGIPAAVNPDRRLRRVAAHCGWPVLELERHDGTRNSG